MSKMTDDKQKESIKMRTEVKEVIRNMLARGTPLTMANICKEAKCSRSFLYNSEMKKFIKEQREKQREETWRVDIEMQNNIYHSNLMATYIFLYSILDEQEEFYKTAIQELKDRETPFVINNGSDSAIEFICQILSRETNSVKITDLLNKFKVCFSESIPNWKEQVINKLEKCLALDMLKNKEEDF